MKLVGDSWNPTIAQSSNPVKKAPVKSTNSLLKVDEVPKSSAPKPLEMDKLSFVANKLAKAEATSKAQLAEIGQANTQLKKAQSELELLETIKTDKNEKEFKKFLKITGELENENKELKAFLKQHGLKWIDKNIHKPNLKDFKTELDLELIAKKIQKLNDEFEKASKYEKGKDGAYRLSVSLYSIFRDLIHSL